MKKKVSNKSWWTRFTAPTPRHWVRIQKVTASLLAAWVSIGGVSATVPGVTTPQWYIDFGWYVGAMFTLIIAYAQSKEEKKNEQN